MPSFYGERAIADALEQRRALLKFVSANEADRTGRRQYQFHLPSGAWKMFTPHAPATGINREHPVRIRWQDAIETESVVMWREQDDRREHRLTLVASDLPFLNDDSVGSLLVLIPESISRFRAYVLDHDDDVEFVQAALGAEVIETWSLYGSGREHI